MANGISAAAARIFIALQQIRQSAGHTGDATRLEADYRDLSAAAGCARATVASGIRELKTAGWVTQHKRYGRTAVYTLHPPGANQNRCSSSSVVQTTGQNRCSSSSVVQTFSSSIPGTTGADLNIPNQSAADSAAAVREPSNRTGGPEITEGDEAFRRVRALLSEYGVGEPERSQLARRLMPRPFEGAQEICRYTREEWRARPGKIKNPTGLIVVRLRDYAAGVQLPLLEMPVEQPARGRTPATGPQRATRQNGRPQRGARSNGYRRAPKE